MNQLSKSNLNSKKSKPQIRNKSFRPLDENELQIELFIIHQNNNFNFKILFKRTQLEMK